MASKSRTIVEHIGPFLDYCEVQKGFADNTQKNYQQYLRVLAAWLKATKQEGLLPGELSAEHVWNYRLYLARKHVTRTGANLSKKSQNFYLIALRALLRYFADRDIESLPSSKVTLAKQDGEGSLSFLESHEFESMLQVADTAKTEGLRDRAIMEALFSSGMRVSEIVALNVDDVAMLTTSAPTKTLELSIVGKGRRVRTVFLSARACDWVRAYLASRGPDDHKPLFINSRMSNGSEPLTGIGFEELTTP